MQQKLALSYLTLFLLVLHSICFAQTDSPIFIENIVISGNKHTKEAIIKRELVIQINDTISSDSVLNEKINQCHENLINTSLFHFVTIEPSAKNGKIVLSIHVVERWYLWPFPLFKIADRNFNTWWQNKDIARLNYGIYITQENFRGRKETLKLLISLGYDQQLSLSYKKPYINKKQTIGLGFEVGAIGNHEVNYGIENNKQLYFTNEESYSKKESYAIAEAVYRPSHRVSHIFQVQYHQFSFNDTLLKLYPLFSRAQISAPQYASFFYQLKVDYRNFKSYPTKGYYFDIISNATGPGNLPTQWADMASIYSSFRFYDNISSSKWYYAAGFFGKVNMGNHPAYFWQRDMGYNNDFVRGYEYNIMNGYAWGICKANIKYALIKTHIQKFNFIKTEKFNTLPYALYLNFFTDAGYMKDKYFVNINNNPLHNAWLVGAGLGIDFVTYYDKVMRVEYSFNKQNGHGLFLHFIAPI